MSDHLYQLICSNVTEQKKLQVDFKAAFMLNSLNDITGYCCGSYCNEDEQKKSRAENSQQIPPNMFFL